MKAPWWVRADTLAAAAAASLAATWLVIAVASAVSIAPGTAMVEPSGGAPSLADPAKRAQPDAAAVDRAVRMSLFRIDRRPPPRRYLPPGSFAPPVRTLPSPSPVVLTGTVVYPDGGGLALVHVQGRGAMVKIGDTIGGLTLRSVAREAAVFARPGGATVVLRVPKAGG